MSKSRDIVDLAAVMSKAKIEPVEEVEEKPKVVKAKASRKPKAMELVEKKLKVEKKEEVKPKPEVKVMSKVEEVEEKPSVKAVRPKRFEKGSTEAILWAQKMREAKLAKKAAKDAEPVLLADD
jgi:hypothetical protein